MSSKLEVFFKATNGIVLATEKKQKTSLNDDRSINKIESIASNLGMVYSGMGPDYRLIVKYARKLAQQYQTMYDDSIPTVQLVRRVADVMQEYTQSGYILIFFCLKLKEIKLSFFKLI